MQGVEVKKLFKGGEISCFGDFMREVPEGKRPNPVPHLVPSPSPNPNPNPNLNPNRNP